MNLKNLVGTAVFTASMVCRLSAADAHTILTVDGVSIPTAEIERKQGNSLFQARNTYFQAERAAVQEFVDGYLLEREAKKMNLTVEQLLDKTVYNTMPGDPSEEALRFYYEGLNAKEPFEAVRQQIIDHIRNVRKERLKTAYMAKLKENAKVVMSLSVPRAEITTSDAPSRGEAKAKVQIVEYADYECPYCQQVRPALDRIEKDYAGKINFFYKDTPLPSHANAAKAAEAAHCSQDQNKYWEMHDTMFKTKALDVVSLKDHAKTMKLDTAKFDTCLDSGKYATLVKAQLDEAMALKIEGTPSFFINGRFYAGNLSYEDLKGVIDEELANSK
jgi:protein-disulfide isomerase